ncbi:MAG: Eco29kI family restriction endonuclease [Solirubrobacteraceae bacterium]
MPASADFKLSISRALTDQLRDALHQLEPASLMAEHLDKIEPRQGVYQLYLGGDLVYVGSASASLRDRLTEHMWKVAGRQNIAADEVQFTCLYVDEDLTVLAPEERLIRVFQDEGSCAWNGMGFGLHDPGRNRDSTVLRDNHFDLAYPIRLDWVCEGIAAGTYTVLDMLAGLKRELPYNFRYKNDAAARSEYAFVSVDVPDDNMTALALFELIAAALPAYQITSLPGYVIMYKESGSYPQGHVIRPEDRIDPSGP